MLVFFFVTHYVVIRECTTLTPIFAAGSEKLKMKFTAKPDIKINAVCIGLSMQTAFILGG